MVSKNDRGTNKKRPKNLRSLTSLSQPYDQLETPQIPHNITLDLVKTRCESLDLLGVHADHIEGIADGVNHLVDGIYPHNRIITSSGSTHPHHTHPHHPIWHAHGTIWHGMSSSGVRRTHRRRGSHGHFLSHGRRIWSGCPINRNLLLLLQTRSECDRSGARVLRRHPSLTKDERQRRTIILSWAGQAAITHPLVVFITPIVAAYVQETLYRLPKRLLWVCRPSLPSLSAYWLYLHCRIMQRLSRFSQRCCYSVSRVIRAEAAAPAAADPSSALTLNFSTPHLPLFREKAVDKVILPGENGEYGVTAGHSPMISQLQPGVVSIVHLSVYSCFCFPFYIISHI